MKNLLAALAAILAITLTACSTFGQTGGTNPPPAKPTPPATTITNIVTVTRTNVLTLTKTNFVTRTNFVAVPAPAPNMGGVGGIQLPPVIKVVLGNPREFEVQIDPAFADQIDAETLTKALTAAITATAQGNGTAPASQGTQPAIGTGTQPAPAAATGTTTASGAPQPQAQPTLKLDSLTQRAVSRGNAVIPQQAADDSVTDGKAIPPVPHSGKGNGTILVFNPDHWRWYPVADANVQEYLAQWP